MRWYLVFRRDQLAKNRDNRSVSMYVISTEAYLMTAESPEKALETLVRMGYARGDRWVVVPTHEPTEIYEADFSIKVRQVV